MCRALRLVALLVHSQLPGPLGPGTTPFMAGSLRFIIVRGRIMYRLWGSIFRCTPRPGTRAFKRMQAKQAEQKRVQEAALVFIGFVLLLAFIAVFLSAY